MPFFQQKNIALVNAAAFIGLMLALPVTLMLILMDFKHPFSILISSVFSACLILGFNGARRVEWSKALFSFAPALIISIYSLLEISTHGLGKTLNYTLSRQALGFALLVPIIIYGYEESKRIGVVGICSFIFLGFDVGSMRIGAYRGEEITGISHGLFTLLSALQYVALAGCILYLQNYHLQHAQQIQRTTEKLRSMTIRDGLTGLFTHSFIEGLIGDAINRSKRSGNPLALLMIDIDLFKQINDTHGHIAGDEVLVELSHLLKANKRSTDYIGRWGGDELVILLTDTNLSGAQNLAEKLRNLVEYHTFPSGKRVTISLGASQYQDGDNTSGFIACADAALYRAKRRGRNKVDVHLKNNQVIDLPIVIR